MAPRNLTAVEGFRFFLFLGIFVFHCVSNWLPVGWAGVQAFLVIGSFFLTRKYIEQGSPQIKVGQAFTRRIKRLYPVYISLVILATLGYVYAKHSLTAEPLWYLFSVQNFRCLFENATYHFGFLLGHFWYISLDVWLFLIWVLILRFVPKRHLKTAFTISLLVGILWRTIFIICVPENISIAYMIPIGMMDSWALGGLVAMNVEKKGANSKLMWTEIVVGLFGVVLLTVYNAHLHGCGFEESYQLYRTASGYMQNPLTGQSYFFVALFFVGLLRYCTDAKIKHPILSATPLVALGGMTYELYCFHYPVRYAAKHFIHNDVLMVLVALMATYVVTMLWNKLAMPIVQKIIR